MFDHEVDNTVGVLHLAANAEHGGGQNGAPICLKDRRPDDQIRVGAFILQGDEHHAFGGARHLADSPRDLNRLMNALAVTWPAIGEEVNPADFIGMETLRILQPAIHRAIRLHKDAVCGLLGHGMQKPKNASLGWLTDFSDSAWNDYHPREGKNPEPPENCLVLSAEADRLRKRELKAIQDAAKSGALMGHRQMPYLLYRWRDLAGKGGTAVKKWTKAQLKSDEGVAKLARAFTSYSWSQGMGLAGMGDRVAKRNTRASVDSLETIMDTAEFRRRVEALAAKKTPLEASDASAVRTFLEAWRRRDKNPRE